MLTTKEEIDLSYIVSIIKFEPTRPVWMLKDVIDAKLVLKREECKRPGTMHENARLLGAISKSTKPGIVTDGELDAIARGLATAHYHNRFGADQFGKDICDDLLYSINKAGGVWVRLPFVAGLTDLECAAKNLSNSGDKSGVRAFAVALNRDDGCEKLGELVAFDLFMGNRDRFSPNGGGLAIGDYNPIVIVNVGNIFAAADSSGKLTVQALDTFDPSADYGDWNRVDFDGDFWAGAILKQTKRQKLIDYATNIVTDLNVVLGPRNRSKVKVLFGANTKRLDKNAARRVFKGMQSGSEKIKRKILGKVRSGGYPAGLQARLTYLGWV